MGSSTLVGLMGHLVIPETHQPVRADTWNDFRRKGVRGKRTFIWENIKTHMPGWDSKTAGNIFT